MEETGCEIICVPNDPRGSGIDDDDDDCRLVIPHMIIMLAAQPTYRFHL